MSSAQEHQEIIIIKRGHDDHDDHHGGAWKIAFADFMTAMMALFLVLWLVNAANEETKKAVASYFNPVKLVDRNRSVKGVYDAQGMQEVREVAAEAEALSTDRLDGDTGPGAHQAETQQSGDADFFADPYDTLEQIASTFAPSDEPVEAAPQNLGDWQAEVGERGEEMFLDPFAPERWTQARPETGVGEQPLSPSPVTPPQPPVDVVQPEAVEVLAEVDPLLAAIPEDGHSANRIIHRIVDTDAFGAP